MIFLYPYHYLFPKRLFYFSIMGRVRGIRKHKKRKKVSSKTSKTKPLAPLNSTDKNADVSGISVLNASENEKPKLPDTQSTSNSVHTGLRSTNSIFMSLPENDDISFSNQKFQNDTVNNDGYVSLSERHPEMAKQSSEQDAPDMDESNAVPSTPTNNVTVTNVINYPNNTSDNVVKDTHEYIGRITHNVTVNNVVNIHNFGNDRVIVHSNVDNESNTDSLDLSQIECYDNINLSHNDSVTSDNPSNKNNLFSSYDRRRRLVKKLKDCIKKIGNVNQQGTILSDVLNSPDMADVLKAGNIVPPKQSIANQRVVNQLWKQLDRSSMKNSLRGRVNDDCQSYRINSVALLSSTPDGESEKSLSKSDIVNMICNNTSIPRTTARRLLYKARKQRCILTKNEKDTTWSIICHRTECITKQSPLNASLFEWILAIQC